VLLSEFCKLLCLSLWLGRNLSFRPGHGLLSLSASRGSTSIIIITGIIIVIVVVVVVLVIIVPSSAVCGSTLPGLCFRTLGSFSTEIFQMDSKFIDLKSISCQSSEIRYDRIDSGLVMVEKV
jgi:hypothetical protein